MLLTREELQERLIALHRASLQLAQDVPVDTLLERIARMACEQARARYAALGVLGEDGRLKQFITVGMTKEQVRRIPHPPRGIGLIGALMNTRETIRLADIAADPRSAGFPPNHPVMRTFLGVPIRSGERQLGQIYLTDKEGGDEFTADDETIIQMLAAYAAVAIQNARMLEELRRRDAELTLRNQDLALLNDVASALTSSLELDEILNKTLALVMNYAGVEAGEIFLVEEDRQTLRLVLHRGQAAEAFWGRNRFQIGEGVIGLVAQGRQPFITDNIAKDSRFLRESVVRAGFRSMVCVPLVSGENLMGVLSVFRRGPAALESRSVDLLTAVGRWAGLAIENARLHNHSRRLAVLEERERIGMDLHDGIIQSIFGIGLSLENISHLVDEDPAGAKTGIQRAIDGLNQTIRDLRAFILDLRPRQLQGEGLLDGIRRLVTEFRTNTLAEASLNAERANLKGLSQECAMALFLICQEALSNVARHAEARRVEIILWSTPERVLMEVRDDGRGFDLEQMGEGNGYGLANMQARARSVNGEVDISSTLGEGTTILAWVPRQLNA